MALASERMDLVIDQGARFYKKLVWKDSDTQVPRDLTGYKANMQVREAVEDTTAKLTLSTESITKDGNITLGGALGTIELEVLASVTTAISDWTAGVWDLELYTTADDVVRLVEGKITVSLEVTRV